MAQSPAQSAKTSLSTPRIVVSPWIVLLIGAMGFFMILLDTTIVNVAIPSMIDGLHASLDQILWVVNGYILVLAVLLITSGRMGDMFGPRRMFLIGLAVFTAASAACGVSQDPTVLIGFRVVQGIGAAILMPQSLTMIPAIFPPEKRGGAFGAWAAVAGLAAVTGPTLGGFLTTNFSWRAIFYVNVPIGIAAMILAFFMMPELTIHRKHHLDLGGILLASSALFFLAFGLIEGQRYEWGRLTNTLSFDVGSIHAGLFSIPTFLALGAVLLAIFVFMESRADEPLMPLGLFHDRNFTVSNLVSTIVAFGMFALFPPMTIFLQSVLGLKAVEAGVVFVPMSLTSMFVAPLAGRLSDRINGKYLLFVGLALFAIGIALVILTASLTSTGLSFTPPLILAGIGMGCTFAPLVTMAMRDIAPQQAGAASGFINTIRQVGGIAGSAVVGAILQNRLAVELKAQATHYASQLPAQARTPFINGFSHVSSTGFHLGRGQTGGANATSTGHLPPQVAHHIGVVAKQVFDHGFLNAMKPSLAVTIGALTLGALTTLAMRGGSGARVEESVAERPQASPEVLTAG